MNKNESAYNNTKYDVFNENTSIQFEQGAVLIGTGYCIDLFNHISIVPFCDIGLTFENIILSNEDIEAILQDKQDAWDFTYRFGANLDYFSWSYFLELSFYYEYYRPNINFKPGTEGVRQDVLLPIPDAMNPHRFYLSFGIAMRLD